MARNKHTGAHIMHASRRLSPNARALREMLESKFGPYGEDGLNVLRDILHGKLESVEERLDKNGNVVEIVNKPTIGERYAAAELALAYINGRPAARLQVSTDEEDPTQMSDGALEAKVVGILTEVAKRRGFEPSAAQLPAGQSEPENGSPDESDGELVDESDDEGGSDGD